MTDRVRQIQRNASFRATRLQHMQASVWELPAQTAHDAINLLGAVMDDNTFLLAEIDRLNAALQQCTDDAKGEQSS